MCDWCDLAQEELTLEGLADQLAALVTRIEAIESKLTPPVTSEDTCVLYSHSSPLQRETITKYIDAFEEEPGLVVLRSIYRDNESGRITAQFSERLSPPSVTEIGDGCEFVGASDWAEDD